MRSRRLRTGAPRNMLLGILVALAPGRAAAECRWDSDCGRGVKCVERKCVDPRPPSSLPASAPAATAQQGMTAPGAVLVVIKADPESIRHITIGGYTCGVPCQTRLAPGVYVVIASGRDSFAGHLTVPDNRAQVEFVLEDARRPYRIAGSVMVPLGIAVGFSMWALGLACPRKDGEASISCWLGNLIAWPIIGGITMITGIAFLAYAAGGRTELRLVEGEREGRAPRLRLTGLGLVPSPSGLAFGASLAS
jgi:hypothetical protein